MNRFEFDFIKRAEEMLKEEVEKHADKMRKYYRKWNIENRDLLKESQRKYAKTEKGAYYNSKRNYKNRMKDKYFPEEISWKEKILIGRFYKNCPKGYEVDHIYPLSKGGKHRISNLQYLTHKENNTKRAKLDWKKDESAK